MDMERMIRTQSIKIHLIFKPMDVWTLKGKGGTLQGVKAKFQAVRLTYSRTGEEVALKLYH